MSDKKDEEEKTQIDHKIEDEKVDKEVEEKNASIWKVVESGGKKKKRPGTPRPQDQRKPEEASEDSVMDKIGDDQEEEKKADEIERAVAPSKLLEEILDIP